VLSRFWRSFPGITVRLHEFQRDAIEQSLVEGSVDAAIMLVSNLHDRAQHPLLLLEVSAPL